ncbi:hypothetical protein, partial [Citrobacter youngae]|uniref:hypothetical protein n=1 Tax=Citrobacter youngae TaxID=133448 RepID=UPI0019535BED
APSSSIALPMGSVASLSGTEISDTIRYVEITYKVENSGNKNIQFFSMNDVAINDKQHFELE